MNRFSSSNQAQTLRIFFSITQARIDRDLGEALFDIERILGELDVYHALAKEQRTPELSARQYHNKMLQAHCLRKLPTACEDEALFFLKIATLGIVNDVGDSAMDAGRIGELTRQMMEIEQREGLKKNDYWSIGEGPPDYQAAGAESLMLQTRVEETVFLHVLRRYRFNAAAELYEKNPMEFDVMREAGRRRVMPGDFMKLNLNKSAEECLLKEYGQAAVDLLHQRLKENGEREVRQKKTRPSGPPLNGL
jgi:hypothetical protein